MNDQLEVNMAKPTHRRFPRRTQSQWQRLIEQYETSDLPVEKFCERNSISKKSLEKWRYKLNPKSKKAEFVEMTPSRTVPQPAGRQDWAVELHIGEHLMLRIRQLR
jgi:hypothetical protein